MEKNIEEKLKEEANFGDLVEVTLNQDLDYCARHENDRIIITPREKDVEYQERAIIHITGYYGGMRDGIFKESFGVSERGATPVLIHYPAETIVCLDPTLHREDAINTLKFQGDGLVMVPISAIDSYNILSKTRRGLRAVN